jgi:hypothetical protein
VSYLFGFLVLEIERMAAEGWKERRGRVAEHGTKWKNSFRWGAVYAISRRLEEQAAAKQATVNSAALVLLRKDDAEVDAAIDRLKLRKLSGAAPSSADGYREGQRAGREMQMSGAPGAIEASKKRVAGGA